MLTRAAKVVGSGHEVLLDHHLQRTTEKPMANVP